jgi:hypothetical protein
MQAIRYRTIPRQEVRRTTRSVPPRIQRAVAQPLCVELVDVVKVPTIDGEVVDVTVSPVDYSLVPQINIDEVLEPAAPPVDEIRAQIEQWVRPAVQISI